MFALLHRSTMGFFILVILSESLPSHKIPTKLKKS